MAKKAETARNLVAFVADDVRLELPWNCEIDIWRAPDIGISRESSASGWYRHVEDIYRNKSIAFELLSIDVFYTQDYSDPVHYLLPEEGEPTASTNIPAGLVHGLAAMARRQHSIDGNVMPLAFEVRTVSPSKDGLSIDQWCDITRIYGILLALMTPYDPDGGFIGLGEQANPVLAVRKAFTEQPGREGAALGLAGLLDNWRKRFLENLKAGDLSIDVTELKKIESFEPRTILAAPNAFIALIGRNGQICDRIALRSIFTDLALVDNPEYAKIGQWITTIIKTVDDLMGKAESTARWVENLFAQRVPRTPRLSPPKDMADYWETIGELGQSLALVAAHVAPIIAPLDYPKFRGQTDFANAVGAEHFGENKIKRMFEASKHIRVKTMRELTGTFLNDLSDTDLVAPLSPLFIRALARSMAVLGLTEDMKTRAPLLFRVLDEAS